MSSKKLASKHAEITIIHQQPARRKEDMGTVYVTMPAKTLRTHDPMVAIGSRAAAQLRRLAGRMFLKVVIGKKQMDADLAAQHLAEAIVSRAVAEAFKDSKRLKAYRDAALEAYAADARAVRKAS